MRLPQFLAALTRADGADFPDALRLTHERAGGGLRLQSGYRAYDRYFAKAIGSGCAGTSLLTEALQISLHFAVLQRDFPPDAGMQPASMVYIGTDASLFNAVLPALSYLTAGFIQLCAAGADISKVTLREQPTPAWQAPAGTGDDLRGILAPSSLIQILVLDEVGDEVAFRDLLDRAAPLCDAATILLCRGHLAILEHLAANHRFAQMVRHHHVFSDEDCQRGLFVAEEFFSNPSPRHRALTLLPGNWTRPHQPATPPLPLLRTRQLPTWKVGGSRNSVLKHAVEIRPPRDFRPTVTPEVIAAPPGDQAYLKQLTEPWMPIPRQMLSVHGAATFSGSGLVVTAEGEILEESFLPVIEAGEPNVWGRNFPLGKEAHDGHLGFVDRTFLVPGPDEPGKFHLMYAPKPVRKLSGAAFLMTGLYSHVYAHWIIDILSKLWVLPELTALGFENPWIVTPCPLNLKQRKMLHLAGIADDRIVSLSSTEYISADIVLVPTRPARMYDYIIPEVMDFYDRIAHRAIEGLTSAYPPRIYAAREGVPTRRRFIGEEKVAAHLDQEGYVPIRFSQLSMEDEIGLFRAAQSIVAPHGSALTGMVFMSPGARVDCLVARDLLRTVRHHYTIAAHRQLRLNCIIGEPFASRPDIAAWVVDDDLVKEALANSGSSSYDEKMLS